jgi:hypothetical protein
MYDMIDIDILQKSGRRVSHQATVRSYRFPFLGTSVFVLSSPPKALSAVSAGHTRMREALPDGGHDVDILVTDEPMWLYCRHKQAGSAIQKAKGEDVEMTLAGLAEEFGLDEERTARYLVNAGNHEYTVIKRAKRRRGELEARQRQLSRQLDDPTIDNSERTELLRLQAELTSEIAEVSDDLLGPPTEVAAAGDERG